MQTGRWEAERADLTFQRRPLPATIRIVLEVFGEVHRGHAAFAEVAFDLVAVSEGGREPGGDLGGFVHGQSDCTVTPLACSAATSVQLTFVDWR